MARLDATAVFDTSSALLLLDDVVRDDGASTLPSAGAAWDAAWIACLTNSPAWAATALSEFSKVTAELGLSDPEAFLLGLGSRLAANEVRAPLPTRCAETSG